MNQKEKKHKLTATETVEYYSNKRGKTKETTNEQQQKHTNKYTSQFKQREKYTNFLVLFRYNIYTHTWQNIIFLKYFFLVIFIPKENWKQKRERVKYVYMYLKWNCKLNTHRFYSLMLRIYMGKWTWNKQINKVKMNVYLKKQSYLTKLNRWNTKNTIKFVLIENERECCCYCEFSFLSPVHFFFWKTF